MDFETKYWHKLDDGRIQCDLCPRNCKLKEGQKGLCFVRKNIDSKVFLTTYGRSSSYCIDPIEKKPLNHFLPGSPVLSFGTAGCNLACKFCQNWDISKSRELDTLAHKAMPEDIAKCAKQLGCKSVAFTYNDPIIFMEYAIDTSISCKEENIKTVAVTAGYISEEPRVKFFKHIDAANIDLKAFDDKFYKYITGSSIYPILDTLIYLKKETKVWFEITTLLIPGENDSEQEINKMSEWIVDNLGEDIPLHFSAFHPDWKMKDKPKTPIQTLQKARKIALSYGMNYVYTGNVHDREGDTTYCHNCKQPVIVRDWYEILYYNLSNQGNCNQCGAKCHGVFDGAVGSWGNRRQLVNMD